MSLKGDLQEGLTDLEEMLYEALEKAKELSRMTDDRVFSGQLKSYLIGTLDNFIEDEQQPGSVACLREYLEDEFEDIEEDDGEDE